MEGGWHLRCISTDDGGNWLGVPMRWFLVSFVIWFVGFVIVGGMGFMDFVEGIRRSRGHEAAATYMFAVSIPLMVASFLVGWYVVGRPQLLKNAADAVVRHRTRAKSLGERIVIATVSTLVVTFVMLALGFSTEVKLLVIPLGFIAIFIGASVLG